MNSDLQKLLNKDPMTNEDMTTARSILLSMDPAEAFSVIRDISINYDTNKTYSEFMRWLGDDHEMYERLKHVIIDQNPDEE